MSHSDKQTSETANGDSLNGLMKLFMAVVNKRKNKFGFQFGLLKRISCSLNLFHIETGFLYNTAKCIFSSPCGLKSMFATSQTNLTPSLQIHCCTRVILSLSLLIITASLKDQYCQQQKMGPDETPSYSAFHPNKTCLQFAYF